MNLMELEREFNMCADAVFTAGFLHSYFGFVELYQWPDSFEQFAGEDLHYIKRHRCYIMEAVKVYHYFFHTYVWLI